MMILEVIVCTSLKGPQNGLILSLISDVFSQKKPKNSPTRVTKIWTHLLLMKHIQNFVTYAPPQNGL